MSLATFSATVHIIAQSTFRKQEHCKKKILLFQVLKKVTIFNTVILSKISFKNCKAACPNGRLQLGVRFLGLVFLACAFFFPPLPQSSPFLHTVFEGAQLRYKNVNQFQQFYSNCQQLKVLITIKTPLTHYISRKKQHIKCMHMQHICYIIYIFNHPSELKLSFTSGWSSVSCKHLCFLVDGSALLVLIIILSVIEAEHTQKTTTKKIKLHNTSILESYTTSSSCLSLLHCPFYCLSYKQCYRISGSALQEVSPTTTKALSNSSGSADKVKVSF